MKLMNLYGLKKSRIHIRTVCAMYTMVNIGNVRVKVIGHDVQTYFSLIYNYINIVTVNIQCRSVWIYFK